MSVLPATGSFLPRAGTNSSRGTLFEDWLKQSRALLGASTQDARSIVGGVLSPQKPRVVMDTQGAAAADDLTSIAVDANLFAPGTIFCLSIASAARKITVLNASGNIILKTTAFLMADGWMKLWLQWDGANCVEYARDYGQAYALFRQDFRLNGDSPVQGEPATYGHASAVDAAAATSQNKVMTPAATSVALNTAAIVVDNKTIATALSPNDTFLLSRDNVLYRMNISVLLAKSFLAYAETGEVTLGQANSVIAAHTLGSRPKLVRGYLRCKTAELGHNANEELPAEIMINDGVARTVNFGADTANYWVRLSNVSGAPKIPGRGTGNIAAITPANWRFFMRMWA